MYQNSLSLCDLNYFCTETQLLSKVRLDSCHLTQGPKQPMKILNSAFFEQRIRPKDSL